ncbi:MAG TPA: GMC family oxidoreductase [Anaerolineaceae bacterium]
MIFDGEKEMRAVEEAFDYVIVGSGAAGATAARTLADTGASIAVVEEGPTATTAGFSDQLFPSMQRIFRGGGLGALTARGRTLIPVIQGSCLGGTTVVNAAIMWRIPDDVWEPWNSEYGLGQALPLAELHKNWDQIESELFVRPTPAEVWGENNRLLDIAKTRLSVSGAPTRRAVRDCRGSARCFTGCPYGAKQSMLVSYIPYADRRGASIFTGARVDRILIEGDRAEAVTGFFHTPGAKRSRVPFTLHARKAVILAASAIQTPLLLQRSGVRSPHLGAHFQGHPGCSLIGVFDRPVNLWSGATQGYESGQHRIDGGFKVEPLALQPELVLASLPGVGRRWVENMAEASHLAVWAAPIRAEAQGTVRLGRSGAEVRYDLTPGDMDRMRQSLKFTAELFFAAGAREVIPNVYGLPQRLQPSDGSRLLGDGPLDPAAYGPILTHLFGTARMSVRPQDGVVGADFCVHGARNFYVVDSSIFPTNLGVNPQLAIMGIAMHAARQIAAAQA